MVEDPPASTPEPPDIRPSGRHTGEQYTSPSDGHKNGDHVDQTVLNNLGRDRRYTPLSKVSFLTSFKVSSTLVFVSLALLLATGAHAQNVDPQDPFTSPSADSSGLASGNPKPLLSTLKWIFGRLSNLIAYATGFDASDALSNLVHSAAGGYGLGKRAETETIVEGIMIPVLVVLSGIFAGLTLG